MINLKYSFIFMLFLSMQAQCPPEWSLFERSCYLFEPTARTWAEQEASCVAEGGHLASIHSVEENQYASSLIFNSASFGAFLGISPGTKFRTTEQFANASWSDNTPNDYANWGPGLPNGHNEECVHMFPISGQGKWNDMTCTSSLPAVCKQDADFTSFSDDMSCGIGYIRSAFGAANWTNTVEPQFRAPTYDANNVPVDCKRACDANPECKVYIADWGSADAECLLYSEHSLSSTDMQWDGYMTCTKMSFYSGCTAPVVSEVTIDIGSSDSRNDRYFAFEFPMTPGLPAFAGERNQNQILNCCAKNGVWAVTDAGLTACDVDFNFDDFAWPVSSCCVEDLERHLSGSCGDILFAFGGWGGFDSGLEFTKQPTMHHGKNTYKDTQSQGYALMWEGDATGWTVQSEQADGSYTQELREASPSAANSDFPLPGMHDWIAIGLETTQIDFFAENCHITQTIPPTTSPTVACVVEKPVDLAFVVDSSGSVGQAGFTLAKQFVAEVADRFPLGASETRVGITQFSDNPQLELVFSEGVDRTNIQNKLGSMFWIHGRTETSKAIEFTTANLFNVPRPEATPVMIVITDGVSSDTPHLGANEARAHGITLMSVGVGSGVDHAELVSIANEPDYVFRVTDYNELVDTVHGFSNEVCQIINRLTSAPTSAPVPTHQPTAQHPSRAPVMSPTNAPHECCLDTTWNFGPQFGSAAEHTFSQSRMDSWGDAHWQSVFGSGHGSTSGASATWTWSQQGTFTGTFSEDCKTITWAINGATWTTNDPCQEHSAPQVCDAGRNLNHNGPMIARGNTDNACECEDLCRQTPNCGAWTWTGNVDAHSVSLWGNGGCLLRRKENGFNPNYISSDTRSGEINLPTSQPTASPTANSCVWTQHARGYIGGFQQSSWNYISFNSGAAGSRAVTDLTIEQCGKLCDSEADCVSFDWAPAPGACNLRMCDPRNGGGCNITPDPRQNGWSVYVKKCYFDKMVKMKMRANGWTSADFNAHKDEFSRSLARNLGVKPDQVKASLIPFTHRRNLLVNAGLDIFTRISVREEDLGSITRMTNDLNVLSDKISEDIEGVQFEIEEPEIESISLSAASPSTVTNANDGISKVVFAIVVVICVLVGMASGVAGYAYFGSKSQNVADVDPEMGSSKRLPEMGDEISMQTMHKLQTMFDAASSNSLDRITLQEPESKVL